MSRVSMLQTRLYYRNHAGVEQIASIAEAAEIAFEDCAMVRSIPHFQGSKHTPGRYWSASNGDLVAFESFLESKWMMLLDFDPAVVRFSSQPFGLLHRGVGLVAKHIPDLFVRHTDGSGEVIDVKNPERLADPAVLAQAERTAEVCDQIGWDYRLLGEPDRQRFANVAWLAGFRRPLHAGAELVPHLLSLTTSPVAIADLLRFAKPALLARSVLFHLLWHGELVCDLNRPLRESTLISRTDRTDGAR